MGFDENKMFQAFAEIEQEWKEAKEKRKREGFYEKGNKNRTFPWDSLREESKSVFEKDVSDEWECEQYKERGYIRDYNQVKYDVWEKNKEKYLKQED